MSDKKQPITGKVSRGRLSAGESALLIEHLAGLSASQLPLDEGLCLAAHQHGSRRFTQVLLAIAEELRQGLSIAEVLKRHCDELAIPIAPVVLATERAGDFLPALAELVEQERSHSTDWRRLKAALTYPLLTLVLAGCVFVLILATVMPQLTSIYRGFDVELPSSTRAMEWLSEQVVPWLPASVAVIVGILVVVRLLTGAQSWRQLLLYVPLVGRLWRWSAVARWCRMLATLLKRRVPLPDAVRLAGQIGCEPWLQTASQRVAEGLERGEALADLVRKEKRLPATLAPLLAWGERSSDLPSAVELTRTMLQRQIQLRTTLLSTILPPIAFTLIGAAALFVLAATAAPLTALLTSLTAGPTPPSLSEIIAPANLVVLILLGVALLCAVAIGYGTQRHADEMRRALWISGWVLITGGMVGASLALLGALAIVLWIIAAVVALMVASQSRRSEQLALVSMLAIAAERQIPLEEAARAFADERRGELGLRASRLATYLDAGVPLADALSQSRAAGFTDVQLAARIGEEAGDVAAALERLVRHEDELERTLRAVIERLLYVLLLLLVGSSVLGFTLIRIIPFLETIFQDLEANEEIEVSLPWSTQLLLEVSDLFTRFGFLLYVFIVPLIIVVLLQYVGWWPRRVGFATTLSLRADGALIMRALALAVGQNRPIDLAIAALCRHYPKAYIQRRLWRAHQLIGQGMDWCTSLRRVKLLRASDVAVLQAAQRVGNLAWALDEMASSGLRRLLYRIEAVSQFLFPAVLLLLGLFTLLIAFAILQPLVDLIIKQQ